MISIKTEREIKLMKDAGHVLGETFTALKQRLVPGMSTYDVARIVDEVFKANGATSAELGYGGYPESACVSVNEELVHGIPSKKKILHDGDIVSVDLVSKKGGYLSDACRTYPIGIVGERQKKIIQVCEECFWKAVSLVKAGVHLGDIEAMVEATANQSGYTVAREYTGHGIGTEMHEDPYIPNYGTPGTGMTLKEGMTICIEPMILEGRSSLRILKDGWTAVSKDGKLTCHYENTVLVTKDGYEILSLADDPSGNSGLNC